MTNKFVSNMRRAALGLVCAVTLVSCDRLLTPDFNTEVSELRGGA